jgi:hypothetical protein
LTYFLVSYMPKPNEYNYIGVRVYLVTGTFWIQTKFIKTDNIYQD